MKKVKSFQGSQLWRHNQAGDIVDPGTEEGRRQLIELAYANVGRRGYTYTHHRQIPEALEALREANAIGFTVNASCESLQQADRVLAEGVPAVAVVPVSFKHSPRAVSPAGNRVIVCPAQRSSTVDCATCRLCQSRPDDVIIAFQAHGTSVKKAEAVIAAAVG